MSCQHSFSEIPPRCDVIKRLGSQGDLNCFEWVLKGLVEHVSGLFHYLLSWEEAVVHEKQTLTRNQVYASKAAVNTFLLFESQPVRSILLKLSEWTMATLILFSVFCYIKLKYF